MGYKIEVSQNFLSNAAFLFNATLSDILDELLQNARRSRAGRVDIEVERKSDESHNLTIANDGDNFWGDYKTNISLGNSGWEEQTQDRERPAGMGIFSCAARGITIESNLYSLHISPDAFIGKTETIEGSSDVICGTKITIPISLEEVSNLQQLVERKARYNPIDIFYEGRLCQKKDFVENAVYKREWKGLELSLFRAHSYDNELEFNFYGLIVNSRKRWNVFDPHPSETFTHIKAKVNVVNCPKLGLVLPSRKEVVVNSFYEELLIELEKTAYLYLQEKGKHSLYYSSYNRARNLGIDLPEAEPYLYPYRPYSEPLWRTNTLTSSKLALVPANAVLVDHYELENALGAVIVNALNFSNSNLNLVEADDAYRYYSWYEKLPEFEFLGQYSTYSEESSNTYDSDGAKINDFADNLEIEIRVGNVVSRIQTDVLLLTYENCGTYECLDYKGNPRLLLSKKQTWDSGKILWLEEFLTAYCFEYTDEDNDDTRLREWKLEMTRAITTIVSTKEEALNQTIREALVDRLRYVLDEGNCLKLTISKTNGQIVIHELEIDK